MHLSQHGIANNLNLINRLCQSLHLFFSRISCLGTRLVCESGFLGCLCFFLCCSKSFLCFSIFVSFCVRYWLHLVIWVCMLLQQWKRFCVGLICSSNCCCASLLIHDSICFVKVRSFPLIPCLRNAASFGSLFCVWRWC